MNQNHPPPFDFFLGGRDLEMVEIERLIKAHPGNIVHNKGLSWGAKASDYGDEIKQALRDGRRPVLVELNVDMALPARQLVIIDHHDSKAAETQPTSLEQVFGLLGLPTRLWSRHLALVAANDRGHIEAMAAMGASAAEIAAIRAADRQAQGITAEQEAAAERSLETLESRCGGRLTLAFLPHSATATLVDRLHSATAGPSYRNLLIVSPQEFNFYGEGRLVLALADLYPQGWYGGELPKRGFWGMGAEAVTASEVCTAIEERLGGCASSVSATQACG